MLLEQQLEQVQSEVLTMERGVIKVRAVRRLATSSRRRAAWGWGHHTPCPVHPSPQHRMLRLALPFHLHASADLVRSPPHPHARTLSG
jgi:hypothetical protein